MKYGIASADGNFKMKRHLKPACKNILIKFSSYVPAGAGRKRSLTCVIQFVNDALIMASFRLVRNSGAHYLVQLYCIRCH